MKQFHEFKRGNEQLNEGLISYTTDLIMAFRIVKILFQDWTKTKAFELGIIDANGNKIKSPSGLEEKSAYSPFIRLVFKLKKLINAVPGGDTKIGSLAAAYALLKENEIDLSNFTAEDLDALFEDAPVNVSGGVAQTEKPMGKMVRRPSTIKVPKEEFEKLKNARLRLEDWRPYVSSDEMKAFVESFPSLGVGIVADDNSGAFYLK